MLQHPLVVIFLLLATGSIATAAVVISVRVVAIVVGEARPRSDQLTADKGRVLPISQRFHVHIGIVLLTIPMHHPGHLFEDRYDFLLDKLISLFIVVAFFCVVVILILFLLLALIILISFTIGVRHRFAIAQKLFLRTALLKQGVAAFLAAHALLFLLLCPELVIWRRIVFVLD